MMKRGIEVTESNAEVPMLKPIEIPFRIESTYPVTLEELSSRIGKYDYGSC